MVQERSESKTRIAKTTSGAIWVDFTSSQKSTCRMGACPSNNINRLPTPSHIVIEHASNINRKDCFLLPRSPADQAFILIMRPDPKPEVLVVSHRCQGPITACHPCAPITSHRLETQRWMVRILQKQRELLVSLLLDFRGQEIIAFPKLRERVRTDSHF